MRSIQFGLYSIRIFFSFSLLVFIFLLVFYLTDTTGEGEEVIIFLASYFRPLMNIHIVLRDFCQFFLVDLFVTTRLIADETCSSLEICILLAFS